MKTVNVSELDGAALDWAVAKCEGGWTLALMSFIPHHGLGRMNFTTDWSQGGPIIEREMLGVMPVSDAWWRAGDVDGANVYGPTALIAAMRCYVASKLGESVEVPEELA